MIPKQSPLKPFLTQSCYITFLLFPCLIIFPPPPPPPPTMLSQNLYLYSYVLSFVSYVLCLVSYVISYIQLAGQICLDIYVPTLIHMQHTLTYTNTHSHIHTHAHLHTLTCTLTYIVIGSGGWKSEISCL